MLEGNALSILSLVFKLDDLRLQRYTDIRHAGRDNGGKNIRSHFFFRFRIPLSAFALS